MFFAKRGLKLLPRERMELDALVKGNVVHYCLSMLTEDIRSGRFTPENLETAYAAAEDYMEQYYNDSGAMGSKLYRSPSFLSEYKKLRGAVCAVVKHIVNEFAVSKFIPDKAEFRFGYLSKDAQDAKYADKNEDNQEYEPPFVVPLQNGKTIEFSGSVDRVDIYENGDSRYIRITDYKTGHKDWDYKKMLDGLDLQPLIYIFALTDNDKPSGRYKGFSPSGTLFLFAYDPAPPEQSRHDTVPPADIRKPIGAVLDDIDVITAMEDIADGSSGKYIPVKFASPDKKTGERKIAEIGSSVLTADEFARFGEHIKKTVINAGERLYSGEVAPLPIAERDPKIIDSADEKNRFLPCTYCGYASLCGNYPPLRAYREFTATDKKTALKKILQYEFELPEETITGENSVRK
jgi:ATP-dependent helicase/nuclease subunit B